MSWSVPRVHLHGNMKREGVEAMVLKEDNLLKMGEGWGGWLSSKHSTKL